jgi:hypothetical protein
MSSNSHSALHKLIKFFKNAHMHKYGKLRTKIDQKKQKEKRTLHGQERMGNNLMQAEPSSLVRGSKELHPRGQPNLSRNEALWFPRPRSNNKITTQLHDIGSNILFILKLDRGKKSERQHETWAKIVSISTCLNCHKPTKMNKKLNNAISEYNMSCLHVSKYTS